MTQAVNLFISYYFIVNMMQQTLKQSCYVKVELLSQKFNGMYYWLVALSRVLNMNSFNSQ